MSLNFSGFRGPQEHLQVITLEAKRPSASALFYVSHGPSPLLWNRHPAPKDIPNFLPPPPPAAPPLVRPPPHPKISGPKSLGLGSFLFLIYTPVGNYCEINPKTFFYVTDMRDFLQENTSQTIFAM